MKELTGREIAFRRLLRIEKEGAYAGLVSGRVGHDSDAREERLAMEVTSGVTRWLRWLDFLIDDFYQGSRALESAVRIILRIGIYELLYLNTPPHAAINEAVELARSKGAVRATGLVNGILRSVDRKREALPIPATGDEAEDLAIRVSHPTWMIRKWWDRFGHADTLKLAAWNNSSPSYAIRINTARLSRLEFVARLGTDGIAWRPAKYVDDMIRVDTVQPLIRGGYLAEGLCVVQDESAGLVVGLLAPEQGDVILDACAAPGGKTLFAAEMVRPSGRVVALDVNARRVKLVARSAERLGLKNVDARTMDSTQLPDEYVGAFDRVLVDAPCSGLGVLAKRADLRWRITEQQLAELSILQRALLAEAARAVRPGGTLVYSTCTIEPEENVHQIHRFLEVNPAFEIVHASSFLPSDVVSDEGFLTTLPHIHGVDGAFGARLIRRTAS
jgi:16S rRNA (cytosine967-C5)-methyltransferase